MSICRITVFCPCCGVEHDYVGPLPRPEKCFHCGEYFDPWNAKKLFQLLLRGEDSLSLGLGSFFFLDCEGFLRRVEEEQRRRKREGLSCCCRNHKGYER